METSKEQVASQRAPDERSRKDRVQQAPGGELLFEQAPEAMVLATGDPWRLVAANRVARELFLFGGDTNGVSELALADLFATGQAALQQLLDSLDTSDQVVKHEAEMRDSFGLTFPAAVSARLVTTDGDEPLLVASFRDVTELKRAEARTRFFYAMANSSLDAIVAWSEGGALVYANPASEELFGVEPDALLGRPVRDLFEDTVTAQAFLREATTRGTWQGQLRLRRADGRGFDASLATWSQSENDGSLPVTVCFARDVTAQRHAETALHTSEERFRTLFESAPDAIFLMDSTGRFVDGNKATEQMFALKREHFIGETFTSLGVLPSVQISRAVERLATRRPGQPIGPDQYTLSRWDGHQIPIEVMCFPVVIGGMQILLGIARDITDRKRAENLMRIQRDLGVALSTARGLDEGLRLCLQAALRAAEMDCGGIYLIDEATGALHLACHKGLSDEFVAGASRFVGDSPNAELIMRGKPLYSQHRSLGVPLDEAGRREALRAIAILPVRHEHRVIACLNVASHAVDEVPVFARATLEAIAAQIGSAIAHLKTEKALHQSEERHRTLIEAVPDIIAEIDAGQHYVWLNNPGLEFFGQDALGRNMADFITDGAARAEAVEVIQRVLDGAADTVALESSQRRHDGAERLLAWTGKPLHDAAGNVTRALLTARDITEMKRMHAKLERYNHDLEALVAERTQEVHLLSRITTSTVTAWVISDPAGRLVRWNHAFEELVGYRIEELVTMRWTDLIPADQGELEQRFVALALAGEGHQVIEQDLCRKGGRRMPVECRFDAIDVGEPEPVVFRIVTDVSSRRETERRLIEARRDAEESSRLKSEFLASISHELRTPLNGILGLANTLVRLRAQSKDEQTNDFLTRIIKSSRHLQNLITEVLDISRIEAGQLVLSLEAVSPIEVLRAAENQFLAAFEDRQLTFSFVVDDSTPPVLADRTRLLQIMVNLLSNAAKFTDPGGYITARATLASDGQYVEFCVTDTGRGIPADKLDQVFERFEQLDRSGSRLGVGLGLAICRQLVVAQGGRIWVESELGVGSRFHFTLPAQTEPISKELTITPAREER